MYFSGRYDYSLDERGRIPLPPQMRPQFAGGVVLQQPLDEECIRIYTQEAFDRASELMLQMPETSPRGMVLRRGFFAQSFPAELDKQGRLLIPPPLRRSASLDGTVVLLGAGDFLEVWSTEAFGRLMEELRIEYPVARRSLETRR